MQLPDTLQPYFWDCDFCSLSWEKQRDFIIRRLLRSGSWEALTWLRNKLGDVELGKWIEQQDGAGLSPRQMRFWELMLELPHSKVNRWVGMARQKHWNQRTIP